MFTSVTDDITSPIVNAGLAATPATAEETDPVLLGGLIEWNNRNIR